MPSPMNNNASALDHAPFVSRDAPSDCRSIEWYSEGQTRYVEVGGSRIEVRFVGRRGRRGRIAITAPAGAAFISEENGNGSRNRSADD